MPLGMKRGAVRILTSSPFGALFHIYFISVVWRKEGSGYVEVLAVKLLDAHSVSQSGEPSLHIKEGQELSNIMI